MSGVALSRSTEKPARVAHREPVGLASFWEHKARGSGLEAARAAPVLRE